jgi:hypothetical protein
MALIPDIRTKGTSLIGFTSLSGTVFASSTVFRSCFGGFVHLYQRQRVRHPVHKAVQQKKPNEQVPGWSFLRKEMRLLEYLDSDQMVTARVRPSYQTVTAMVWSSFQMATVRVHLSCRTGTVQEVR